MVHKKQIILKPLWHVLSQAEHWKVRLRLEIKTNPTCAERNAQLHLWECTIKYLDLTVNMKRISKKKVMQKLNFTQLRIKVLICIYEICRTLQLHSSETFQIVASLCTLIIVQIHVTSSPIWPWRLMELQLWSTLPDMWMQLWADKSATRQSNSSFFSSYPHIP